MITVRLGASSRSGCTMRLCEPALCSGAAAAFTSDYACSSSARPGCRRRRRCWASSVTLTGTDRDVGSATLPSSQSGVSNSHSSATRANLYREPWTPFRVDCAEVTSPPQPIQLCERLKLPRSTRWSRDSYAALDWLRLFVESSAVHREVKPSVAGRTNKTVGEGVRREYTHQFAPSVHLHRSIFRFGWATGTSAINAHLLARSESLPPITTRRLVCLVPARNAWPIPDPGYGL